MGAPLWSHEYQLAGQYPQGASAMEIDAMWVAVVSRGRVVSVESETASLETMAALAALEPSPSLSRHIVDDSVAIAFGDGADLGTDLDDLGRVVIVEAPRD